MACPLRHGWQDGPACLPTPFDMPRSTCPLVQPRVPGGALACPQARVQPRLMPSIPLAVQLAMEAAGSPLWHTLASHSC